MKNIAEIKALDVSLALIKMKECKTVEAMMWVFKEVCKQCEEFDCPIKKEMENKFTEINEKKRIETKNEF